MKNRRYYKEKKYLVVRGPDAFDVLPEDRERETCRRNRDVTSASSSGAWQSSNNNVIIERSDNDDDDSNNP